MWPLLQQSFSSVAGSLTGGVSSIVSHIGDREVHKSWLWLLAAVALVDLLYRLWSRPTSESFWSCPSLRRIYSHRSAVVDYKYFLFSMILVQPFALSAMVFGSAGARTLTAWLGPGPGWTPGFGSLVAFTLAAMLLFDIGHYINHYLLHRIPALWEFHKVHHSAEVLTPISTYRAHPVESLIANLFETPMSALGLAVFYYLYGTDRSMTAFAGFNIIYAVGFLVSNIRHSQIWISYGPLAEYILSSPAQHQIHHSRAARHIDKNFAQYFSFIDWACGTLYVPQGEEQLEFGLHGEHDPEMDTLRGVLWAPLKRAAALLKPKKPGTAATLLDCSNCDARALQENR